MFFQLSVCSSVSKGVSSIIDVSWSPWELAAQLSSDAGVPLICSSLGSQQLVAALDQYLSYRNVTDAAIIVETEAGEIWVVMVTRTTILTSVDFIPTGLCLT